MPQDPGIGTGVGGFFASLMNPGLAGSVAQHITPNPNPLAQQGGPPGPKDVDSLGNPVPTQQPNLAPAAVTQPDPVNSSYAADLMRYDRMNKLSDDLNRNIQGVAAGFGTAQQQASKTRRRSGAGGSVGDLLGCSLAGIQKMQDQNRRGQRYTCSASWGPPRPSPKRYRSRSGGPCRSRKPRPFKTAQT